ncbi:Dabb family protein [Acidithrix sp. C25]|uniref:Dabb family protein n=1 Tax=Acidithrix sp. C25 TaxID=1671482 RepID=UPI00191BB839|nr:Dabb family protein [Acidithrix sp. C25]
MLRHMVIFKFKEGTDPKAIDLLADELSKFYTGYVGFTKAIRGKDLKLRQGNGDLGICVDFESEQEFRAYADDKDHLELIKNYVAPIIESRAAVQIEI